MGGAGGGVGSVDAQEERAKRLRARAASLILVFMVILKRNDESLISIEETVDYVSQIRQIH